jgi:hypothetical protein
MLSLLSPTCPLSRNSQRLNLLTRAPVELGSCVVSYFVLHGSLLPRLDTEAPYLGDSCQLTLDGLPDPRPKPRRTRTTARQVVVLARSI